MPRFLRGVLCVMETFRRYADEDGDKATLTCSEMRRLLQGEFGDLLQPNTIHAVEENLNLLDVESNHTISFDEFVLAIFNFPNLHHPDKPSLQNSEPGRVSDSEWKEAGEERADLAEQAVPKKRAHPQMSAAPKGDSGTSENPEPGKDAKSKESGAPENYGRTSETQELPARERAQDTREPPAQHDSGSVSETPNNGSENTERSSPEAQIRAGQKEAASKTHPPSSEAQMQDEEHQEAQEPSAEKDTRRGFETQGLSSEESSQNQPEAEGAAIPGEEAPRAEGHTAEAFADGRNGSAAPRTLGDRGRTQELALLENGRATRPGDKPTGREDGSQGEDPESSVTQKEEESCETPKRLAPGGGSHMQGDSQTQAEPCEGSVRGVHSSNPESPKQGAPDEDDTVQEMVQRLGGEDAQLPGGHESQGSETGSPATAVELKGRQEAQESTAEGKNRGFPDAEIPGDLEADFTTQASGMQLPEKENGRKEPKIQPSVTKEEEDGAQETPEILLNSQEGQIPASPMTHLKREEPATLEEEDRSPQEQAEGDGQRKPAKKESNSSISQSGTEERRGQRGLEPRSAERSVGPPSGQYRRLQEKIVQQGTVTQEEPQHQVLGEQEREAPVPQMKVKAKKQ